jgi:diguanylate cyclase (GGDEF)-like protein
MSRMNVENVPPLDLGMAPDNGAGSRLSDIAILAAIILAASLFGNFTRPVGHLSAFWPSNALLLGMLLRNPRLATPFSLLAVGAAYVAADLIGGGTLKVTLLLTAGNMFGAIVGYLFFSRLDDVDKVLGRPRSVLYLVLGAALAAASAGVIGGLIHPVLFNGTMFGGWKFWFVSEAVNYVAILPVVLTLPNFERQDWLKRDWRSWTALHVDLKHLAPAIVLVLSAVAGLVVGGPGSIGFPVPALLWCALVYSQFATALLTLLFSAWTLLAISSGYIPLILYTNDWSTLMSIRIGVTLIALAPITVASVTAARNELLQRLKHLATHDHLTGLLNRGAFQDISNELLRKLAVDKKPVAMLMLDIDRFKDINDTYGHAAGDRVLTTFSHILGEHLRLADPVARVGGEEFAILLPDCSPHQAETIADRIRTVFADTAIDLGEVGVVRATVSIGAVTLRRAIPDVNALLLAADKSLYRAKQEGRNRVERGALDSHSTDDTDEIGSPAKRR